MDRESRVDPISVLADHLCAAEAEIRTASDACDIARENHEAAKAARAWRPKPRTSPDLDDIDDNDVRDVMLSLSLANLDDCGDSSDELAFYARCIHAYMRDNGSWTRACIDDAASMIERRASRDEDVILCKYGDHAAARHLSPVVSMRATAAQIRALRSIEDRQDPRAAWLFAQLAKPNNGFPSVEECRREAMELERMEDAKGGAA